MEGEATGARLECTVTLRDANGRDVLAEPVDPADVGKGVRGIRARLAREAGRELQPLDMEAVKRNVLALLERADAELSRGADGCNTAGLLELEQCAHDARAICGNLAAAVSALRLLEGVQLLLERRIAAVCEVRDENYRGERFWAAPTPLFGVEELPERFCGLVMDEEHPF